MSSGEMCEYRMKRTGLNNFRTFSCAREEGRTLSPRDGAGTKERVFQEGQYLEGGDRKASIGFVSLSPVWCRLV